MTARNPATPTPDPTRPGSLPGVSGGPDPVDPGTFAPRPGDPDFPTPDPLPGQPGYNPFLHQARLLYPGLPEELLVVFADSWSESGDPALALAIMRAHTSYDFYFAGNKREDGTVRYSESEYLSVRESFEDTLLSININPDLFAGQFVELIEGNVSPNEFTARIEAAYERIIDAAPGLRAWYANNYGIEMSDEAIVASFLDADVGTSILEKRIAVTQVGAAAFSRGFDIDKMFAEQITNAGVGQDAARELFTQASDQLPILSRLAQRHDDPNDEFNLDDFVKAFTFGDARERNRIRNLYAAERSSFSSGGGLARTQGGVTGLVDR